MTESQISFLYKAAHSLPPNENNHLTLLKSYYLTRCKDITKGYGLPEKQFSTKVRCSHCCIEWRKDTQTRFPGIRQLAKISMRIINLGVLYLHLESRINQIRFYKDLINVFREQNGVPTKMVDLKYFSSQVRPIKLSKKQRRRIRSKKANKIHKNNFKVGQELLNSNEIEQICNFCKHSTVTPILKPEKEKIKLTNEVKKTAEINDIKTKTKKVEKKEIPQNNEVNVYSNAKDIFSLKNKKNILPSVLKDKPKINNNKKKKDKFAGLCQKAALASAKVKQADDKKNKLNLFLRPSS